MSSFMQPEKQYLYFEVFKSEAQKVRYFHGCKCSIINSDQELCQTAECCDPVSIFDTGLKKRGIEASSKEELSTKILPKTTLLEDL